MSVDDRPSVQLADGAADLVATVMAAGWRIAPDAPIRLVDARDGVTGIGVGTPVAALVAVVADDAAIDAAGEAGATHVATGLAGVARALSFATRAASGLRDRRGDDAADRYRTMVAALVVVLTSVEVVNAAFGRDTGDAMIEQAHDRLRTVLATHAAGASLLHDGASFTIWLPADTTAPVAAAIERTLALPFEVAGQTIYVGARIGIARREAGEADEHLVRRAAEAVARGRGGDAATTQIASTGGGIRLSELAADLHRAIDRDEIDVLFQPQVALADGRITGVEALARWRHPRRGPLGAGALLAAAERAGLGIVLSAHIQALALARAARWPEGLSHLRLALNVTAADIARADFVDCFLARVDDSGVARGRVTAEIVETGLIDDLDAARALLTALRDAGCRVAVDDFGTGYSSLAYLTALPLDYLKIDRALTQDIVGDRRQRAVTEGVIAIARALGLETVAEGVETAHHRALLAARGCTYYQGFLCAPPLDDAALVALVESGTTC